MRRRLRGTGARAALALALVALAGFAAVGNWAGSDTRREQQTLGVFVRMPVAPMKAGDVACQGPIGLVADTHVVKFNPGTPQGERGPAIEVTVRSADTGRPLGSGEIARGFDPRVAQTATIGTVPRDQRVDVCFRDLGPGRAILFGDGGNGDLRTHQIEGVHPIIATSHATLNGTRIEGRAIAIVFPAQRPRSALALIPAMARHAAVFRPGPVGAWTFLLLGGLLLVGAPALLAAALILSGREDQPAPEDL